MNNGSKIAQSAQDKRLMAVIYVILGIATICCILPFLLLISASLTDEMTIVSSGYNIWPRKFSLDAYRYLFTHARELGTAYGITILVTLIGTSVNLVITMLLAYVLSRRDLPGHKFFNFMVVFCIKDRAKSLVLFAWRRKAVWLYTLAPCASGLSRWA